MENEKRARSTQERSTSGFREERENEEDRRDEKEDIREEAEFVTTEEIKRGEAKRKTRSKKQRREEKKERIDLEGVKLQLLNFHFTLVAITGIEELMITEKEAELLATALVNFVEEFGIYFTSKVAVVVNLVVTIASIYAPRMIMIKERRKKNEKAASA